jgi:hypothetical protein
LESTIGGEPERLGQGTEFVGCRFFLAMKHQNHTHWSATAAIAAALALSATPLSAQDASAPVAEPLAVQPVEPAPTMSASPVPTVVIPDVTAPAATGAGTSEPASEPSAKVTTTTTRTTAVAPTTRKTTRTAVTRTVTSTAPAVVAPVVVDPPASADPVAPADETLDTAPVAAAPTLALQPTPSQTEDVTGTLGLALLGLLALATLVAGMLFFRRRHPVVTQTVEEPAAAQPVVEAPAAEPAFAATSVAAPTMLRRRDINPIAGALPSDGAAVDLPAELPESYEERNALFERMVAAQPDRANPFTDKRQRMKRARLIMQSLGVTFDREPRIDLSQYPNNWPELRRQYRNAA